MAGKQGNTAKTEKPGKLKTPKNGAVAKVSAIKGEEAKAKKAEPEKPIPVKILTTREFFLDDFSKTFFPLQTNRVLVELGETEIKAHIAKCLDDKEETYSFLPQRRVFVSKPHGYLRRTVKLDVIAEYYLYDVIYRNRELFRNPHVPGHTHYGYRIEKRVPIAATNAYKAFKGGLADYGASYDHSFSMDVATYFNSLYHHDLVNWFHDLKAPQQDAEGLGQLLREIAGGRSVDCLPQGLYPAKMIGNDFLRFIEQHHDLKSDRIIRFMDDIVLFADDRQAIDDDFQTIQRLIGDKGLSLNSRKTRLKDHAAETIESQIDEVKRALLRRRRIVITAGYDDEGQEIVRKKLMKSPLSRKEMGYIETILAQPDIEEEDAELLLTIMRGNADKLERRLPYIMKSFPHLAKNIHAFCADFDDKEALSEMLLDLAKEQKRMPESQLFWFCAILADQLMSTSRASALISVLLGHDSATTITKAKILEIPDIRFGLQDTRNEQLAHGQSDWLGWASAVGSRVLNRSSRNHRLKYWAKASNMNHLITTIMGKA